MLCYVIYAFRRCSFVARFPVLEEGEVDSVEQLEDNAAEAPEAALELARYDV